LESLKSNEIVTDKGAWERYIEEGYEMALLDFNGLILNSLSSQTQTDILLMIKSKIDTTFEEIHQFKANLQGTAMLNSLRSEEQKLESAEQVAILTNQLANLQVMLNLFTR
jgi:hypothetical protein